MTTLRILLTSAALLVALPVLAEEGSSRIPAVSVATVQERAFVQRVPVSGTLIPQQEVLVYPEVSGYAIRELAAEVGDTVKAGDLLALIDDRILKSQVAQAEGDLASAQAALRQAQSQVTSTQASLGTASQALERTRSLRSSGTATQAALDDAEASQLTAQAAYNSALDGVAAAEARLNQSQIALEQAQQDLENAHIVAPVDGIISERNAAIGAIATTAGDPVFRLIGGGAIEMSAEVIETDLVSLHAGDKATVDIAGLPAVTGTVRLVPPAVDPQTRLGEVRISLDPVDGLRTGLFASGSIVVTERSGLGVPAGAVLLEPAASYVLRIGADDTLDQVDVVPGLLWDGWMEVVGDLAAGDEVVARAGAFFAEGDTVRPLRDTENAEVAQ